MSSLHLSHTSDSLPPAPPTEAELFTTDDLEFRTISTLLRMLGTRERIALDNFHVSQQQRPSLKLLTALASLLVRNFEILAVMPKRSGRSTTLFVGSLAENTMEKDFSDDEESTTSQASSSSHETFIARNPEFEDHAGQVELLEGSVVDDDVPDVFSFILENW